MKRVFFIIFAAAICAGAYAQKDKRTTVEFDKTTYDMGTFSADSAVINCFFVCTNTGENPLYIHQVYPSCSCTSKRFPTTPIMPGKSDTIFVTYDGKGKSTGYVRKYVTVHSNSQKEMVKLYIKGYMKPIATTPVPEIKVDDEYTSPL